MMDRILFWVYVIYYKVYKNVLGLMLSNIEYVKVSINIYINTLEIRIEKSIDQYGVTGRVYRNKEMSIR